MTGQRVATKRGDIFIDNDLPLDEHNPCAYEIREANSSMTDEELATEDAAVREGWQLFYGREAPW